MNSALSHPSDSGNIFGPKYQLVDPDLVSRTDDGASSVWELDRSWFFFDGFFPGFPVLPFVFLADAAAQAVAMAWPNRGYPLLSSLGKSRIKRISVPGETLRLDMTLRETGDRTVTVDVAVINDGSLACRMAALEVRWFDRDEWTPGPLSPPNTESSLPAPHSFHGIGDPCRYLDRLTELDHGVSASAEWRVRDTGPYALGHFEDWSVVPAAYVLESIGQTSVVAYMSEDPSWDERDGGQVPLPGGVNSCWFKRPVHAGELLESRARVLKGNLGLGMGVVESNGFIDGEHVARVESLVTTADKSAAPK